MPDKHEVGGSSPLGPTTESKTLKKKEIAEGDLVLSSSENRLEREWRSKKEGTKSQEGKDKVPARHKHRHTVVTTAKPTSLTAFLT